MVDYNIDVIVDPSKARVGSRAVKKELQGVKGAADGLQRTLTRTLGLLGVGAGLGFGISVLADFGQEMSTVKAITQATGAEFTALEDRARELGATTRFSATQAAEGMSFLARAGFETNEIMASVGDTLLLAQAGALDLGSAADIASNVLTGFRLQASQAGEVVDILAAAANSANTNVQQLGEAAKFVAPVAAGMNVSLAESAAAIGALSDAGLQASLAGTGLRRILSELESPAENTKKIFRQLGISADEVKVSQVGLTEALHVLAQAGVDTGLALQIFGDRGGPAFEVLSSSIPKVEMLTEKFNDADGTARRMADVMDDNLRGAMLAVRSAVEATIISFGKLGSESALTGAFRSLASIIRTVADNMDEFVGVILTAAAAWATYTVAMNAAALSTVSIKGALIAAGAAMKTLALFALANPFVALATALVAITGLLITFADRIGLGGDRLANLRDVGIAVWDVLSERLSRFIGLFKIGFNALIEVVESVFGDINISLGSVILFMAKVVDRIIGMWVAAFKTVKAVWDFFPSVLKEIAISAVNGMIAILEKGVNAFIKAANTLTGLVNLPQIAAAELARFDNTAEGTARDFGRALGEAMKAELEFSGVQDVVTDIFDRAETAARNREALANAAADTYDVDFGGPNIGEEQTRAPAANINEFDAVLDRLRKEQELIGLTTAEREIQNAILQIETDLKRELTDVEQGLAEKQLRINQSLTEQAQIYENINAPVTEYQNTLANLNALLEQGKINQAEFNAVLQQTELASAVAAIQVGGTDEFSSEITQLQERFTQRQLMLQQAYDAELLTQQQYNELSLQLAQQHSASIQQVENKRFQLLSTASAKGFQALANTSKGYVGEQSATYRGLFALSKSFGIADTTVAIAQGIANSAKLGWPQNIPAIAATISQTAGLLSMINSTSLGFQSGGGFKVGGSGGPDSQMVAFRASPNESVSVRTPGQERAMTQSAAPSSPQPISIVNVDDPGRLEDFMASPAGEKTVLNAIRRNPSQIRQFVQ
jgi:TP901 family phage tail tape measure protein